MVEVDAQNSPSAPLSATRKSRRYGFACDCCKARKVKCSGDRPVCTGCQRTGERCVWPSQKNAESRLRNANARIRDLEASLQQARSASDAASPRRSRLGSRDGPTSTSISRPEAKPTEPQPGAGNSPATVADTSPVSTGTNTTNNIDRSSSLWYHVGIGDNGSVIYNGPTSRFHAGLLVDEGGSVSSDVSAEDETSGNAEADPTHAVILQPQYALMDSVWMPLIAAKPSMNGTGVNTKTGMALLDIYWTWLHPLHNCVYRPAFLMDLALGGPNCSDFLLLCIFGLAARHLNPANGEYDGVGQGERFIKQAQALLLEEMAAMRPAIPTIQGLLILGGRQCAMGKGSQGWLYTGMAIRMMQDIGLHLNISRLIELERWTPAEAESRKRLYNSAYLWDKTLSLALGRPPSLIRPPYPRNEINDKFDDERLWCPVHANEVVESFIPSPSWTTSTFCFFGSLHEITTDMMLLFSSSTGIEKSASQINDFDARFRTWYEEMPTHLKIDEPARLKQSPPPHIVSLNLLYHTLHILLRRPFLGVADESLRNSYTKKCSDHSKEIHSLHTLYTRTYPHRLMTYQVSYCIYTAATVEAMELKRPLPQNQREECAARLAAAVQVLQNEATHTPGSGKSLDAIRRLLSEGDHRRGNHQRIRQRRSQPQRVSTEEPLLTRPEDTDIHRVVYDGQISNEGLDRNSRAQMGRPHHNLSNHGGPSACVDIAPSLLAMDGEAEWNYDIWSNGTDTGAGFHPEAFPWGISDQFPRIISTANVSLAGMGYSSWPF